MRVKSLQSCLALCNPPGLGLQPARLLCPGDPPGNDTGGGRHASSRGSSGPQPGLEPVSLAPLHWWAGSFTQVPEARPPPHLTLEKGQIHESKLFVE